MQFARLARQTIISNKRHPEYEQEYFESLRFRELRRMAGYDQDFKDGLSKLTKSEYDAIAKNCSVFVRSCLNISKHDDLIVFDPKENPVCDISLAEYLQSVTPNK